MTRRRLGPAGGIVLAALAVAAVSLLARTAVTYDAWGWLVWGREVGRLDLDTTGGPSWKPLPVAVTAPLSVLGDGAPTAWLLLARAAGLLALAGAYRLAARSAGVLAGMSAAVLLVLTPDPEARFARLLLEGHTAPAEAALWLWAIDRHLAGRRGQALALGTALALLRPEAWPFLAGYAVWLWWREPARRVWAGAAVVVVPLLWFGGDWWGSGDPWHGAELAQVAAADGSSRLTFALEQVARMVVAPVWAAAAFAVVVAWRRRDPVVMGLAALVVAWSAVVTAMSVAFGYAALSRFLLPAAALACVLAGIGIGRLVAACRSGPARVVALAATAVVVVAFASPAVRALDPGIEAARARERFERDLDAAIADAGRGRVGGIVRAGGDRPRGSRQRHAAGAGVEARPAPGRGAVEPRRGQPHGRSPRRSRRLRAAARSPGRRARRGCGAATRGIVGMGGLRGRVRPGPPGHPGPAS